MQGTAGKLFVVFVLSVIGAACTTTTTGTAPPDGGAGGNCGGIMFITPGCQSCFTTSCCAEGSTCEANQACAALNSCNIACHGDATCESGCSTANPNGQADYDAFSACINGQCDSACNTASCGGYSSTNTCFETCFSGSCCAQGTACGSTDCTALFDCGKACSGDSTCIQSCETAHPSSVMPYQNLINCIDANCGSCPIADAGP